MGVGFIVDVGENNNNIVGGSVLKETRSFGEKHSCLAMSLYASVEHEMSSAASFFALVWEVHEHFVVKTVFLTEMIRFLGDNNELTMLLPSICSWLDFFVNEFQELTSSIVV
jgi:hypothetical protein